MTLYAFTDGASRGNPGESGIGLLVKDENGNIVLSLSAYIGKTTNNIAEYTALLVLLKRVKDLECTKLVVHSDSELMVRQIHGQYKVKDTNIRKYYQKVAGLLDEMPFEFELKHIPREQNSDADRLANRGIETKKRIRI
jgi:ribonuclease HI